MTSLASRQTRRRVLLEILSLAVPLASAVFFSGESLGDWSLSTSLLASGVTVAASATFLIWHRKRFPADISPWPKSDEADKDVDSESGWWDPLTILMFLVSVVVVVVVGVFARFIHSILVIVFFAVIYGPALGDVAVVVGAMLGVSFVLEFGIAIPLCRCWNLDPDPEPESLDQFCPTPSQ